MRLTRCPVVDSPFGVHVELVVARDQTGKIRSIRPLHQQHQRLRVSDEEKEIFSEVLIWNSLCVAAIYVIPVLVQFSTNVCSLSV